MTMWATSGIRRGPRPAALGERIVLRFDAATHRAVAWVNDVQVVAHEGGYTPFEADVTDAIELGAENRITVVVDNRLTWNRYRPAGSTRHPTARASRPSTTSLTTPAYIARCGSTPPRRPTSVTSPS